MKKNIRVVTILFFLFFSVFLSLISSSLFAQNCDTEAANKPSTFVRSADNISPMGAKINAGEMAKMKPYLAKAESWVKNILINFTGAKLNYYNNFFPKNLSDAETTDPMFVTAGMKGYYQSQMMFFGYYCYDNKYPINTEGESGSSVYVNFNNVFAFGLTEGRGTVKINGVPVFQLIKKKKTEGRVDYYELLSQNNASGKMFISNEYIFLRNSDKPIFIPITRKEYLQHLLKDVDVSLSRDLKEGAEFYSNNIKQHEAEIKSYKLEKSYTPEKEARKEQWFNEDQEKSKKRMSKIEPDAIASKEIILQYLQKPLEWLNKPVNNFFDASYKKINVLGYCERFDKEKFNGVGEKEEYTENQIVSINPAYFNNKFSTEIPQVIMIYLRGGSYPHMKKVAALIHKSGAFAPLEALINPSKLTTPIVTAPEIPSTYSLKYLPKLKTLTPLVIPAGLKLSTIPVAANSEAVPNVATVNFTLPPSSAKLNKIPQLLNNDSYNTYLQQLNAAISAAIKPNEKKKADDFLKKKNYNQSLQIGNAGFAAWLQNAPTSSLYLYSKALLTNPSDALAANNFSAFLIMGGLAEKAVPMLEYWNKQKPDEATLLANLGNAYYRLGNMDKAMNYLLQSVQKDSLHPTANKILSMMYLKKGDAKKAKDHATKSLIVSYDEQVVSLLEQLDNKTKPGEIMRRLPVEEFPMLKRIKLLAVPSALDDMDKFVIELEAEKKSIQMTVDDIESKAPSKSEELPEKVLIANMLKGFPLRIKAQYIIMDGMLNYQREKSAESEAFNYNIKKINIPLNANVKAIVKKYNDQINKYDGGEAGDEDKISALELAKCNEVNAEKAKYLGVASSIVNGYAQRQEYISRKFYAEYATWVPYWSAHSSTTFPSIQESYLRDVLNILESYIKTRKSNCDFFTDTLSNKVGKLKEWEDEYCANAKGELGLTVGSVKWDCNGYTIEGGEGITVELTVRYLDDGTFDDFTIGAGPGVSWNIAGGGIAKIEAGGSVKGFLKVGIDKTSGKWGVKDAGLKTDAGAQANVGPIKHDIKIVELSVAVNAGINVGGLVAPILNLN